MLTQNQENYLKTLPESELADIKPWDPEAAETAKRLLKEIKNAVPDLEVFWSGALALGILGKNDIDFSIVSRIEDYEKILPRLIAILGEPQKQGRENIRWEITRNGYPVDVHLTDFNSPDLKEHRVIFELLSTDRKLLEEYRKLKEASNGLPVREYQRRKYEFYNRVLGIS